MENQQLIDQFDKNAVEKVKVHLSLYNGNRYIDMRIWVASDAGEVATRKGLCLHCELIPDLIAALQKAQKSIQIKPGEATGKAIS